VSQFRLRYQATDLELPVGEFVIGRSSSCNLALDDALVSRRHAVLRVKPTSVSVEDLGSRNGVLVNGVKVDGQRVLKHLDRVAIGSQEIVLLELGRRRRQPPTGDITECHACGGRIQADESRCPSCGTEAVRRSSTLAGATLEMKVPVVEADPEDVTRQATGFNLLAGIAHKALALGRYDEAERILGKHLEAMARRAEQGDPVSEKTLAEATPYTLRLAEGLRQGKWVDWVFKVHAAARAVPSGDTVDTLHKVVRAIGHSDPRALREYLTTMRPTREGLSASDRFVLQRLEGLERVISA
jgi:hypothetical protein